MILWGPEVTISIDGVLYLKVVDAYQAAADALHGLFRPKNLTCRDGTCPYLSQKNLGIMA